MKRQNSHYKEDIRIHPLGVNSLTLRPCPILFNPLWGLLYNSFNDIHGNQFSEYKAVVLLQVQYLGSYKYQYTLQP